MMDRKPYPIALLTDFGLTDWYVAAVKGQILRRLPEARLIDISHGVPAQQIEAGAFLLHCVLESMPEEAVFLCIVDPGVGSTARRAICGRIGRWHYVGPDNGLATPLLDLADGDFELCQIEAPEWRNTEVSATFHGRDVFAPAAARLASGIPAAEAGSPVTDPVMLSDNFPEELSHGLMAKVMLVDHFGNLVTNLTRQGYEDRLKESRFVIRAGPLRIDAINETYAHVRAIESLAYWGSTGTLEIAINHGNAAEVTGLRAGSTVYVDWVK
jgi:S-adenosylmethionine hydrolase